MAHKLEVYVLSPQSKPFFFLGGKFYVFSEVIYSICSRNEKTQSMSILKTDSASNKRLEHQALSVLRISLCSVFSDKTKYH